MRKGSSLIIPPCLPAMENTEGISTAPAGELVLHMHVNRQSLLKYGCGISQSEKHAEVAPTFLYISDLSLTRAKL